MLEIREVAKKLPSDMWKALTAARKPAHISRLGKRSSFNTVLFRNSFSNNRLRGFLKYMFCGNFSLNLVSLVLIYFHLVWESSFVLFFFSFRLPRHYNVKCTILSKINTVGTKFSLSLIFLLSTSLWYRWEWLSS